MLKSLSGSAETGGGGLADIGVYPFGAARFVTGEEPERVTHADIRRENGVDTWVHMAAEFPSFRYHATVSMRMAPRQYVTFQGTEAVMNLTAPFNAGDFAEARLELSRGMSVTTERWPGVNHYALQVEAFGRSLREGADYPCPLEFSRGTQAMIDMTLAAEKGT